MKSDGRTRWPGYSSACLCERTLDTHPFVTILRSKEQHWLRLDLKRRRRQPSYGLAYDKEEVDRCLNVG